MSRRLWTVLLLVMALGACSSENEPDGICSAENVVDDAEAAPEP